MEITFERLENDGIRAQIKHWGINVAAVEKPADKTVPATITAVELGEMNTESVRHAISALDRAERVAREFDDMGAELQLVMRNL